MPESAPSIPRALAFLAARAPRFRFAALTIFGDEAASTVFDRELAFDEVAGLLTAPSALDLRVHGSGEPWSSDDVAAATGGPAAPGTYAGVPVRDHEGRRYGVLSLFDPSAGAGVGDVLPDLVAAASRIGPWAAVAAVQARRERQSRDLERLLVLDAEVTRALAAPAPLQVNLQAALDAIVVGLGAAFAFVWTIADGSGALELQASAGQEANGDGGHERIPAGAFEIGAIAAAREAYVSNDVNGDPSIDQTWARREGIAAFARVPLIADDKLLGVLAVFARSKLARTAQVALGTTSRSIAVAIDRRHTDDKLRARELWLSTTLSSIGDAVIATDSRGLVTYVNAVAVELTGWSRDEALGRSLDEIFPIFHESTGALVASPVDRVLREGVIVGLANYTVLRHRDGHLTAIEDSAAPIRLPGGELTGVVLVFRDATELREAEAARDRMFAHEQEARRLADERGEQLRMLISTAPIAITTWRGPEHRFHSANDVSLAYLGSGREILGARLVDALPLYPGRDAILAIFDRAYLTGEPYSDPELRITWTCGQRNDERVYRLNLVATRAESGEIDGLMACASDVTDAVHLRDQVARERDRSRTLAIAEAESRARSEFLLATVSALSEGLELEVLLQRLVDVIAPERAEVASVWLVDAHRRPGRAVHAPRTAMIAAADTAIEASGQISSVIQRVIDSHQMQRIDDLHSAAPDNVAPEYTALVRALALQHALYLPIARDGRVAAVLSIVRRSGRPFDDGDISIFRTIARQIALALENARLYAETDQLRRTAETATLAKDQFLSQVSHDLRNPLGSILGWSSSLRQHHTDPAQVARGLEVIERNAKAQVQLIEDLLDISRITSGKLRLEVGNHDIRDAIDTALDPARIAADARNVRLDTDIEPDIGSITVDIDRFRQVVWNLVSNAVRFTPSGGRVTVRASRRASGLEVVVSDTGAGIAPEFLPRIFEKFEQAEQGSRRGGGLGLGLAIVRNIVELHGGSAAAASPGLGKGAQFTIRLPIRAAVRPDLPHTSGEAPAAPAVLRGTSVLIVDDEADARDVVAAILERVGAQVTVAESVDEAFALFQTLRPDAIVSDIGMPGKDGKMLARLVRGLGEADGGGTPAVALTALARAKDRIEVLSAGFSAHVAKPVEPGELVIVLAGLLRRDRRDPGAPAR